MNARIYSLIKFPILVSTAVLMPLIAQAAHPERDDDSKRKSKNGKLETTIDGVGVTLTYGRPKVKGRKIWDKLVPYGELWRAGADEPTVITFSKDAQINGKALPAGTYAFYILPKKDEMELIFYSEVIQWFKREASKDALKISVKPVTETQHIEELDYVNEGKTIKLRWAKTGIPFTVTKG